MTHERTITTGYLLILGVCLYLWPNVAGIATVQARVLWLLTSVPLLFFSAWSLHRSLRGTPPPKNHLRDFPWWFLIVVCLAIFYPLFTIPLHSFTDEVNIVLPALTLTHKIAATTGWPLLQIGTALLIALFVIACAKLRPVSAGVIILALAGLAIAVSFVLGTKSTLATRFPPLVHLFQVTGTILGNGSITLSRAPNILWTMLLLLGFWQFTPHWNKAARYGALLALLLGPMGWVYRVSLYQACGEITLGIIAVLLLTDMVQGKKTDELAPYLGFLLSLWMLYRPTSVVVLGLSVVVLLLAKQRTTAIRIITIAAPIAFLWIVMYPTYKYPFLFQPDILFPAAESRSFLQPLIGFVTHLPDNFHPIAMTILILGSLFVWMRSDTTFRIGLLLAWLMGLSASGVQQMIQEVQFYGYPRFNILMILPFAFIIGGFFSQRGKFQYVGQLFAVTSLILLVIITPFDYTTFAHEQRRKPEGIYQTPTGGDSPLPVSVAAENILRESPDAIFVIPDYSFFDLHIATGLLTPPERTQLIERGRNWTSDSPVRPVIVQAPVVTTYQPNISAAKEERLRQARAWALLQPNHEIRKLGLEEMIIVR